MTKSANIFAAQGVNAVPFWYPINQGLNPSTGIEGVNIYDVTEDPERALSLFLYAFVHGVLMSMVVAVLYIVGASTGGTDFISF
ncbi:hypothetical protein FACS1894218_1730 [Bacilli bacterium]|nr:hypothetical protein FACS1894218_1730 [Bacilli bacterium]